MQPEPGAAYVHGRYYLIPQPYATVKRDIEQGFAATAALRGFQPRDDTAPLSGMEFYWVQVGARHLPALRQALAAQAGAQAAPCWTRRSRPARSRARRTPPSATRLHRNRTTPTTRSSPSVRGTTHRALVVPAHAG